MVDWRPTIILVPSRNRSSVSPSAARMTSLKNTDDPTMIGPDDPVTDGTTAVASPILVCASAP
jgi:hypothetical protein